MVKQKMPIGLGFAGVPTDHLVEITFQWASGLLSFEDDDWRYQRSSCLLWLEKEIGEGSVDWMVGQMDMDGPIYIGFQHEEDKVKFILRWM